jgi:pimeloyl-ACP methyl ester carboxylesterase
VSATRFVANGEVTLALESRGAGPRALLFAHGWISGRRMWYDVVARLDPARFTSHLLDFRGAGRSDRPAEGHDLEGYASDLRAVLAELGPVALVAHSMGGKIAQFVTAEGAPQVERLVLVAPGSARASGLSVRHRALAEHAFGHRARIERFQRGAMTRPVPPEAMERIVEDALVAQREHWFGWYDRGRTADFTDRVGRIAVPTVVVAGENDPLAQPSRLRRDVVDKIPGALFVSLRNAGHNLPVETPDEIAGVIARFV